MKMIDTFYQVKHPATKWEPYFEIYERHLNHFKLKNEIVNLVEVGVLQGGSLEMWSEYFGDKANIIGIDVDPRCMDIKYEQKNIKIAIGDQGNTDFWDRFLIENDKIDIFIDDGGHQMHQQIITFEKVFPKMPVGGIYICEDTHTSYMSSHGGRLENPNSFIEYAKGYVDVLHYNWKEHTNEKIEYKNNIGQKSLTSVHFYDSIVVFEKLGTKEMKCVYPKS